ncbi:MAG: ChaN family lipoprotein [Daejeonella sp.]|uniref:ChaN family lipoprotein n=1 Tax=Daejeonella sp. TaxID=2805397 RepID=UPI003C75DF5D
MKTIIYKLTKTFRRQGMKIIGLSLLIFFSLTSIAQSYQQHYKIYDTRKKQLASLQDIINDAGKADVLFFGEEHNDSIGHLLEKEILQRLNEAYPGKVTLSLEMFQTDVQSVLNEYLWDVIGEKNFITEARAWKNYKDYRPLIEYSKSNRLDVIAANTPSRYTNSVTRNGLGVLNKLPADARGYLPPLPIDTATGRYHKKFMDLLGEHGMGPMKIYQSQNLWDASMAGSIFNYKRKHKNKKIFHINGRFHSDEKLGTYARLKKLSPKLRTLNISCFYDESFKNPDWSKFVGLGDYVIVTDAGVKRTY